MNQTLQQIALVDALLTNWDAIRIKMMPISPALAKQLNELGQKLRANPNVAQLARIIDDLLDLATGTAAEEYVNSLVARSDLGSAKTRETPTSFAIPAAGAPLKIDPALESLSARLIETDSVTGVRRVPVFFATNRLPETVAAKGFTGEFQNAITFGVATVTIPARHQEGNVETPSPVNIFADKDDQAKYFTLSQVQALAQNDFSGRLEKAATGPKPADLLIYLHGYNVTFEEASMRAAQFAVDSGFSGIVVLFSWPSQGTLQGYSADEERAVISGDVMMRFLSALEGGPWPNVHFLAHSMGNRVLLLGFADNPRPKLPLGQLVFAAADVFDSMFDVKFPRLQAAGLWAATSYASKKDRALLLSSQLHMGPRVGLVETAPYMTDHLTAIDATNVTDGGLGHGYWSAMPALLTDLNNLIAGGKSPQDRKLKPVSGYWSF